METIKEVFWPTVLGIAFCIATGYYVKTRPILMKLTAYCPCEKCCGDDANGKTSIGRDAWKTYGVAADPKLLPYGTRLDIPGIGIRIVDDTGGAMRQSAKKGIWHIDIRFHTHKEADEFGVKEELVRILKAKKTSLAEI